MKKFLALALFSLVWANAHQYDVYDINGKKRGTISGFVDKNILAKIATDYHGSVLVKKRSTSKIEILKNPSNYQLSLIQQGLIQKNIDLNRDSLSEEKWIEVEKNEIVKICIDEQIPIWQTSLNAAIYSDSCIVLQTPTLIGVESVNVYLPKSDSSHKINFAIGMKYLDFKNEEILLGYYEYGEKMQPLLEIMDIKEYDPERLKSFTGTYLVDKYPVTKCEFTQIMWDSIPTNPKSRISYTMEWIQRKTSSEHNKNCVTQDSAAETISLYQAIKYANARSIREGLRPYYKFEFTDSDDWEILSKGHYVIGYYDFITHDQRLIQVSTDSSSDGYRLPYYDEWMMLARGGDKKNKAPWGDSTATFEEVSKYARYTTQKDIDISDRVGQKKPNGYGLYDMFGLVEEHVLFESYNPFPGHRGAPSCLKGGQYQIEAEKCHYHSNGIHNPCWKDYNYGYSEVGRVLTAGFRLIRNIGNNAKWSEVKSDKK